MKIASVLENQEIEKRVAITPEIAKKYISLGLEVILSENYGSHLGIKDEEYKELGVEILNDEKKIINNADIIVNKTKNKFFLPVLSAIAPINGDTIATITAETAIAFDHI